MQGTEVRVDGAGAEAALDGGGQGIGETDLRVFDGEGAVELERGNFGGSVEGTGRRGDGRGER